MLLDALHAPRRLESQPALNPACHDGGPLRLPTITTANVNRGADVKCSMTCGPLRRIDRLAIRSCRSEGAKHARRALRRNKFYSWHSRAFERHTHAQELFSLPYDLLERRMKMVCRRNQVVCRRVNAYCLSTPGTRNHEGLLTESSGTPHANSIPVDFS